MLPRRKDSDTDPSTPEALRPADTDPGLGPAPVLPPPRGPSRPPLPPATAAAVNVAAQAGPKKDSVELLLDGKVIARGEAVIVDGNYGLRITEILTPQHRIESLRT